MTGPTAQPIYLDHNASAPMPPAVVAAMAEAVAEPGNPSSVHGFGRAARQRIDGARRAVARLVGAAEQEIVFTSGGTEANNLALGGVGAERILVSAIEHDSVLRAAPQAERIPVTADGVVDLDALDAMLARGGGALVSIMLANNETGVIQPVAEAAAVAHRHGAMIHCDAIQAAGRMAVDVGALGADLLSLSGHKLGGPTGVGALVVRSGIALAPMLRGGGQERWRRAGTENIAGIVGFGAAAQAAGEASGDTEMLGAWRDDIERRIRDIAPDVPIYGSEVPRLANTSCLGMPGVKGETQVMAFDLAGIAVSAGSACSSGKVTPSAVLSAMGAAPDAAGEAIRVSLGRGNRAEDVDRFVAVWRDVYQRARRLRQAA
ncbi:MAG: cysteine desulfurase [Alphaproteobacteria bacterium]|nr:cysteine desulfurase [Alphaproteobacteria bacterium]